jgi:hypothetical protein
MATVDPTPKDAGRGATTPLPGSPTQLGTCYRFLLAVDFFRAVDFFADFLVDFFAEDFLVDFFAEDFFADFLLAEDFLAGMLHLLSP